MGIHSNQAKESGFRVLVNATTGGSYPPVGLPAKEYMERALEIRDSRPDLPKLRLRDPWYGYALGYWSEHDQEIADMMVRGEYREVGKIGEKGAVRAKNLQAGETSLM